MLTYDNVVLQQDLQNLLKSFPSSNFEGKSILITGANGMIATYLSFYFIEVASLNKTTKVYLLARDKKLLEEKYLYRGATNITLIYQDVLEDLVFTDHLDFILHFAGNASPYWIKNDPVGIMEANILGTLNLLKLARQTGAKLIFASTREIYGKVLGKQELREDSFGSVDCLSVRACYPESKRVAETLCESFFRQYGVSFNVLRIAHVYGPGMKLADDGRVMSDFLGAIVNNKDIELKSDGKAVRSFCYISDAVEAVLLTMLKGEVARAYNLANESEEISVLDLARLLNRMYPKVGYKFMTEEHGSGKKLYCGYERVSLNTDALKMLGWIPRVQLVEGIRKTIESVKHEKNRIR